MKKKCVLITGLTIATDIELQSAIQEIAEILISTDNWRMMQIVKTHYVDLILIEVLRENGSEIDFIKDIKINYPGIEIVLMVGKNDRELIATAFTYGVKDAFRKPYNRNLIVERIATILK